MSEFGFTIITVCYNSELTLTDTMESVMKQDYRPIEYIIIDGHSTDNTLQIIENYEPLFFDKGIEFKWISEADRGLYEAMNKGIQMAKREIIGIINSDDRLADDSVSIVASAFRKDNTLEIVHGDLEVENQNLNHKEPRRHRGETDLTLLCRYMIVNHPSVFIKKEIYSKFGMFDLDYGTVSDWELMCRFYSKNANFRYIPFVLVHFRAGGISSPFGFNKVLELFKVRRKYTSPHIALMLFFTNTLRYLSQIAGLSDMMNKILPLPWRESIHYYRSKGRF